MSSQAKLLNQNSLREIEFELNGYHKFFDIAKAGKGKGAVGVTVSDATKNYVVLLELDGYSEVSYNGSVVVP